MTTAHVNGTVIDADGHVLEPRDIWARHLDPKLAELILVPDPTGGRILPSEHNPQAMRPHPISKLTHTWSWNCSSVPRFTPGRRLDPDERTLPAMVQLLGDDRFV